MVKRLMIFCIALIILCPIGLQARRFAKWSTTMGSFIAEIRNEIVPITGDNFISLTESGFYNGLHFHRVIEGFMIQDGCPNGTGTGGPGYTIPDEVSPLLLHDQPGILAMAKTSQPNSAGSQYYITVAVTSWLDGNYAVFGKVIQGLDVVMDISHVATNAQDHPIENVVIDTLQMLPLEVLSVTPEDSVVTFDAQNPYPFIVIAYGLNGDAIYEWYMDGVLQPDQTLCMWTPTFTSVGEHTITCKSSDSGFTFPYNWHVSVTGVGSNDPITAPNGIQLLTNYPNPFNNMTTLKYQLEDQQISRIRVFDIKGRLINEITQNAKKGLNQWEWDGRNFKGQPMPQGVYMFEVKTGNAIRSSKALLLK